MWWMSFWEMKSWFNHVVHTIEHKLKFWNDLKAAKFAKFLWRALPQWIQNEIEAHTEQEESKLMEAKIKELKWMNTIKMLKEIEHILASSKPYSPELEAALMAIISKTWVLYPKYLKRYQWSFMWYEALWWKKWDAMHLEYIERCKKLWRNPPTEEFLVEMLLDYQTDDLNKRRNKFNKQYWNELSTWMDAEKKDWDLKTQNKVTVDWRLDYIIWEFKNLTYWNWIWWMENFVKKWSADGHVMWALPFIILSSWISMDFLPKMTDAVRRESFWNPAFASLSLISEQKEVDLYNNYVARVIELTTPDWKKSTMYHDFQKIW
jgi:hypothetical protein